MFSKELEGRPFALAMVPISYGRGQKVVSRSVLNGLHHEYCLILLAARGWMYFSRGTGPKIVEKE